MLISTRKFQSFGFWTLSDYPLIVMQYNFGGTHSYGSNVYLSSEFQTYIFRCEFAKPRLFRMSLILSFVSLTFKWCPSRFLDSLRLSFISSQIQIWKENHPLKTLKSDIFLRFCLLTMSELNAQCPVLSSKFFIRRMRLKHQNFSQRTKFDFFDKRVFPKLVWFLSMYKLLSYNG